MSCNNWNTVKLGDIADVLSGYAFKTKDFVDKGIPVIKIKNIVPPIIDINDVQYVSNELYLEKEKYALKYNDILISMTGSNINQISSAVGKIGRVKFKNTRLLLNQRVGKLYVTEQKKCDYDYLYYYLIQPEIRYNLAASAGGSANQANINPSQIKNIDILLPELEEQKRIAKVLTAIDNKIELNNEMNKTLEEMAQALFKRWFVDFEFPNEDGEPYKSSGGEMVESELGMIPKGWKNVPIYNIAEYINGTSFKSKDYSENGIPIIKIAELKNGITSSTNFFKGEKDEKFYLKNRDILFSWSGNPDTSIDVFIWCKGDAILNQHIFKVVPNIEYGYFYTYTLLKSLKCTFANIARNKQTTGLGHVTVKDLKELKVTVDYEKIREFNTVLKPIINNIISNYDSIESLTELRDLLLPKLMSGEIRAEDIEANL